VERLGTAGWRIRGGARVGEKKQGRRMAAWRGRGRGASVRAVWGQGEAKGGGWHSRGGAGSWGAGENCGGGGAAKLRWSWRRKTK